MNILLSEGQYDRLGHIAQRYSGRLSANYLDLPLRERDAMDREIKHLFLLNFPKKLKIAYRIFTFKPNPHSRNYIVQKDTPYYRFKDAEGNIFTGNELWVIVNNNNLVTFLVRRSIETQNIGHAKKMFGVDEVIHNEGQLNRLSGKPDVGVQ